VFSLQPRVAKSCDSCTETSDVFATHIALTHLPHVQEAISRINNHRLEDAEKVTRISTLIRQEFNKLFPNKSCFHNQQSTAEIMQLFQRTPRFTGQSSPQFMPSSATMNGKRAESPSALSLAQSQMGFSSTNFPTSFSPRLTAVNTAFSPRLKAAQGFVHKLPPNNLVQFSPRLSPNMSPQMIPQSAVFSSTSFSPRLSASISPIPMPMSMASATASQKAAASRAGGKRGPSNLSLDGKASTLTLLAAATQMTNSTNSMLANQSKAKESPLVIPFASSVVHSSSILAPAPVLHKAIQK
jgi:hypothetical protein